MATQATVTTCKYQSPALSAMAFGVPLTKRFRITFDYYAHGRLYSGEFQSDRAVPQNEHVSLSYNPLDPQQNSLMHNSLTGGSSRSPLLSLGLAAAVLLPLLGLMILRGCR